MILITGATGTVGSEVLKRLSIQDIEVRAVTRDARKAEANLLLHVQFVQGDFEDPESIQRACARVDRAFLLTNSTERAEQQQRHWVALHDGRHLLQADHAEAIGRGIVDGRRRLEINRHASDQNRIETNDSGHPEPPARRTRRWLSRCWSVKSPSLPESQIEQIASYRLFPDRGR